MVAISHFFVALGLAAAASAEYLAVIEKNPTFLAGSPFYNNAQCQDGHQTYEIHSFGEHVGQVSSGCSWKGKQISVSHDGLEGCHGGYKDGWKVCLTSYGGNVHNGKGQHQRCDSDDSTLLNCPNNMPCWTNMIRKLKCGGTWHDD